MSQRFNAIFAILERRFGRREAYLPHPPVEQALVTLLLREGKEAPAERAIKRLQRKFVDWNETRVAEAQDVDEILGPSYPSGVGALVTRTLTAIFNHSQAMNLDDIASLDPEHAEAKLARLESLPSRVAGELLLANLKYTKLPMAEGLIRVAKRTRIVRPGAADGQLKVLRRLIAAGRIPRAFHAYEMLAERVCTAEKYECGRCPVNRLCATGEETLKRQRLEEERRRVAEEEKRRVEGKHKRERRLRARKAAATEQFKKAIQVRSRKLNLTKRKKRRRPTARGAVIPASTRMVQASSAEVRPQRRKARRKRQGPRRRVRVVVAGQQ